MKFGRKNEIKIDHTKYNLMLIGESGVGKTTIIKEYCEKTVGEDGYMFLEMGKEDGADAINGINYVTCPEWEQEYDEDTNTMGFRTFVDDVLENRTTDWKELKVVVIDTLDEIFAIAEPEVIRIHNKENPTKKTKSIKSAFGGFQAGEEKAIEIVQNALWDLKSVGVSFILIGHTKTRNVTDAVTGEDYLQLTTNMSQKYFNALKTKVHFLGVAAVDREIVKERTGKKDFITKEEIKKGVVKSETRTITFRDDNFVIDSKSRFAEIVEKIPMNVDALIKAITDAIKMEYNKSGKSVDEAAQKQNKEVEDRMKVLHEKEEANKSENAINKLKAEVISFFAQNKTNLDKVKPVLAKCRELGYNTPNDIDSIDDLNKILEMCK